MGAWSFFQDQILGMKWLDALVASALSSLGMDMASPAAGALRFFIYDTIKITVLLCVLIFGISYIQSYFPPDRSRRILGRFHGIGANVVSALLGTVTPFCSCSSIPLFIGFTTAGLPVGTTFSFLISSPMVDLGSLVLLMSIFGPRVAVVYVAAGVVLAVIGGVIIEALGMERYIEEYILKIRAVQLSSPELTQGDRVRFARGQAASTLRKVFPYIVVGVAIGALVHNWIPADFVERLLGGSGPLGVLLATVAGAPMYADIFGTIPIAEALLAKGASLGTVLAFMMSVTTLSLPSLILLRKAVKPPLLALFVGICVVGIFITGCLFNAIRVYL